MGSIVAMKREGDAEAANSLRAMADKIESGEIRDWLFVADDLEERAYYSTSLYEDRWRLLGAIEFAKCKIATGE